MYTYRSYCWMQCMCYRDSGRILPNRWQLLHVLAKAHVALWWVLLYGSNPWTFHQVSVGYYRLTVRVSRIRRRSCYCNSVRPSVRLSVRHTSHPRLNGSRYRDMIYNTRCSMLEDCCATACDVTVPWSEPSSARFWYRKWIDNDNDFIGMAANRLDYKQSTL